MLKKKTLEEFIKKVEITYQQFYVWKYTNNKFIENKKYLEKKLSKKWSTSTKDFIKHNSEFQNFWPVTIPSLQQGWMMSVSRLTDTAYFQKNKKKPNISMELVLEELGNKTLADKLRLKIDSHRNFTDSIKEWRNKFLAHNDADFKMTIIKKGFEDYMECLLESIEILKSKTSSLKGLSKIEPSRIEEISKTGVERLFSKITT